MRRLQRDQANNLECIICPFCQYPNKLDADFCYKCEAPTKFEKDQPSFEQIQAAGFLGPNMMTEQPKLIIVLGVWIIFLPLFINIFLLLLIQLNYFWYSFYSLLRFIVAAFLALMISFWIYRTTKNYIKKSKK